MPRISFKPILTFMYLKFFFFQVKTFFLKLTSGGTNDPKSIIDDHKLTPNIIIHFLEYLSPRNPKVGAESI